MKIELEEKDKEEIVEKLIEKIKPIITKNGNKEADIIFNVHGLAEYLKASKQWIYERTHLNEIPFIKKQGLLRFKKKDIDKWLDSGKTPSNN